MSTDAVAIMEFNSGAVKVRQDFTGDRDLLLTAIARLIAAEQGLNPFKSTTLPLPLLQTIAFGSISNQVLGTAPFTVGASATSGLASGSSYLSLG